MFGRANAKPLVIEDLPEEILLKTFKYLSLSDKKSVRLVCKNWFEVCNATSVLDDEVLTCLGVYQLLDIYELLEGSQRNVLNLRFHNVNFFDCSSIFWENNGSRIRSIGFTDCKFQCGIFEKIIFHCKELLHLSLLYSAQYTTDADADLDLSRLTINGVVRENLRSLEIEVVDPIWVSNYIVHHLFSVFPKVKILKISCTVVNTNFEKVELCLSELTSLIRFTFSPILNYLILSIDRIENLKLHFSTNHFSENFLHRIFEVLTAMTKLKELSINMRGTPQLEYVKSFFLSKQLKSLELCMEINCSMETFFMQLLDSNPNLMFLKVSFFNTFSESKVTNIFFEKLMLSCLKSLSIGDTLITLNFECTTIKTSTPNVSLRNLALHYTNPVLSDPQLVFLKYFQNLRHLKLSSFSDCLLQQLFTNQTKLKCLILDTRDFPHVYGELELYGDIVFQGNFSGCSFAKLPELECLELLSLPAAQLFTMILGSESVLLNLKYLRINNGDFTSSQINPSDFLAFIDKMPSLEGLYLHFGCCTTFDNWLLICNKLNRLRYLYVNGGFREIKFANSDYVKLFNVRPSLRAIVHDSNSGEVLASYFFNTLKKEVQLKEEDYQYPLYPPKIGEFIVEWMNV